MIISRTSLFSMDMVVRFVVYDLVYLSAWLNIFNPIAERACIPRAGSGGCIIARRIRRESQWRPRIVQRNRARKISSFTSKPQTTNVTLSLFFFSLPPFLEANKISVSSRIGWVRFESTTERARRTILGRLAWRRVGCSANSVNRFLMSITGTDSDQPGTVRVPVLPHEFRRCFLNVRPAADGWISPVPCSWRQSGQTRVYKWRLSFTNTRYSTLYS